MISDDLQQEIKNVVEKIVAGYQPLKVILFGSAVRGNMRADSDIDLLIIKDDKDIRPFRIAKVFAAIRGVKRNFTLDPKVYTQEELNRRQIMGDYFINEALAQGKILYG